jgi:rhodanese-related sulfurtransferase
MATSAEATPDQANDGITGRGAALIDVREPWEWNEMRIPGAILIPLGELPQRLAEVPDDREVYVHCRHGGRSAKAVDYLREHGRPRAVNVVGGIDGWSQAGLPVQP